MNDMLNQNIASNADALKPKSITRVLSRKLDVSQVLKYIFICSYILIPILSIEGLVSWSIGAIGLYKTVNLYKSQSQNKVKKSICLLVVMLTITIAYNLIVSYIAKIYI
jgi:hypothetical protein